MDEALQGELNALKKDVLRLAAKKVRASSGLPIQDDQLWAFLEQHQDLPAAVLAQMTEAAHQGTSISTLRALLRQSLSPKTLGELLKLAPRDLQVLARPQNGPCLRLFDEAQNKDLDAKMLVEIIGKAAYCQGVREILAEKKDVFSDLVAQDL